ncbi:phenylacetate--CoA ligase family protein [Halorussus halophilus]|uniref:phenylacetate--CoA ligase family protein n=1 Tax=Halorussus halophilus TaxID=2650975 RepID=UPI001CE43A10|nr:phenylacetate--CoA ligase family protein [Halorussus halophilus]
MGMHRYEYGTIPWQTWRANDDDREAIANRQRRRIDETVTFARRQSRFYKHRYEELPEDAAFGDLPPVTKPELMANLEAVVTDTAITETELEAFLADEENVGRLFLGEYPVWTTSGTTGEPGVFLQDRRALTVLLSIGFFRMVGAMLSREMLRKYVRSGGRRAMLVATGGHYAGVAGTELGRRVAPSLAAERLRVFSVQRPLAELVADLNEFRPAMLGGYASAHKLLAREQREGRLDIDPALVVASGEAISDAEKAEVASAFDCGVREHYGATEFVAVAFECEAGALHANTDWCVLEPVDSDYRPVPPGEPSETTLLTNLANRVQPIVRYDLGDSITLSAEPCSCGNLFPTMEIEGRTDDLLALRDADGKSIPVFPLAIGSVVEEVAGVYRYQVIQTTPAAIRVRFETTKAWDSDDVWPRIESALTTFLGSHGLSNVAVERDPEVPQREASGKFRQVVSEL